MHSGEFEQHIARTLLYYEIFDYPLTAKELFALFPVNSLSLDEFKKKLHHLVSESKLSEANGFYSLPNEKDIAELRLTREQLALKRITTAKFVASFIKQFPFVRGVFLSGELSKNVATPDSDIDFVIVTAPKRLWITRTLLIGFKKIFLFNKKKYFCLNYFVTENQLHLNENSYYTASEIAHLKPLYNFPLFLKYINANGWIKKYFPNYSVFALTSEPTFESRGIFQSIIEFFLNGTWLDKIDSFLMNKMRTVWHNRYREYDGSTHERLFRCTPFESRAFIGNFSDKIQKMYDEKLASHHLGNR